MFTVTIKELEIIHGERKKSSGKFDSLEREAGALRKIYFTDSLDSRSKLSSIEQTEAHVLVFFLFLLLLLLFFFLSGVACSCSSWRSTGHSYSGSSGRDGSQLLRAFLDQLSNIFAAQFGQDLQRLEDVNL